MSGEGARPTTSADVRLYLVTGDVGGRSLVDVVRAAVDGGVTVVQLRDKLAEPGMLAQRYTELRDALAGSGVPVLLNDDVVAAAALGADGVHVGPDDVTPDEARRRLGPDALIGWSVHWPARLSEAVGVGAADYLAASPVWPTPTKPDTTRPLGLDGVSGIRRDLPRERPLVAIGGIGVGNAASVIAAGADGVAVVSAVCAADDPELAARELRREVDRALDVRESESTQPWGRR